MSGLIEHLESHLGEIVSGYRGDDTTPAGVLVAQFAPDRPWPGMTTLATAGLSKHHLRQDDGRPGMRIELVVHLPSEDLPDNAAGVLFQIAEMIIEDGVAPPRGTVFGPGDGPVFGRGDLTALVIYEPLMMPESFITAAEGDTEIMMTWLVPITGDEAAFVREEGAPALFDLFREAGADPDDLERESLAVGGE
ncbi:suppressor of fused domain protein [Dactylosporangium sp. CA-139066]|uniref:suppressor of fused domain protein n=1 Tax=Dactylosporangium sp. CA-139066 TaxID=3239930 RepID=UPI003D94654D